MKQSTAAVLAGSAALVGIVVLIGSQFFHQGQICSASSVVDAAGVSVVAAPASGLEEFVDVHLSGNSAAVRDVELCTAAGCSFPSELPPTARATPGTGTGLNITETKLGPTEWRFIVQGRKVPSVVTIRAVDAADRTLVAKQFHAGWERYSPPTTCGDAVQVATKPLVLSVPAA